MKTQKQIYQERVGSGKCTWCGRNDAAHGHRMCTEHAQKMRDYQREWRSGYRRRNPDSVRAHRENMRLYRGEAPCQLTGRAHVRSRLDKARIVGNTIDRAHILPRKDCVPRQASDPNNIIRLCAEAHRLFDGGWIVFDHDGRCLVDHRLEESIAKDYRGKRLTGYTRANDRYMADRRAMAIGSGFRSVA